MWQIFCEEAGFGRAIVGTLQMLMKLFFCTAVSALQHASSVLGPHLNDFHYAVLFLSEYRRCDVVHFWILIVFCVLILNVCREFSVFFPHCAVITIISSDSSTEPDHAVWSQAWHLNFGIFHLVGQIQRFNLECSVVLSFDGRYTGKPALAGIPS